jgi:PIN domain nuclease of toxin-antitoxin system
MILLDTHAWIWWVDKPEALSKKASELLTKAAVKQAIFISAISTWEI